MSKLKDLESLFSQGKINRREFLTRTAALGITVAASPMLFNNPLLAAMPKKGGRFRMGVTGGSTTDSLDNAVIPSMMPQNINRQLRNNLVEIDHTGNPIPELAESWESSPDAAKWVFRIRKGVEFHNGKTMDVNDVIFSINHHRGKDSKSAAKGVVDPIVDIKADGKDRVVFTLEGGNADFPYVISDYHLTIVPNGTTDFEKGVGTGAYILSSHEPGVRALAKRNRNYFKSGRGHFDEIETISISDVTARTNALRTGQIDAMNRCDRKTVHLLERMRGIKIIKTDGTKHYTIPMNASVDPYKKNQVRLAMKYAIDREALVKTVLNGYGSVGNDHPIGRNQPYFSSDLPQRQYDPDRAKYFLKQAEVGKNFKLHVSDAAFGGAVDAAVLYKEHAAKAGINIEVVKEPEDGYWSNVWMKKPFAFSYWSGRSTPDWMFSIAYAEKAKWNESFWKHGRFNDLLVQARAELDQKKRGEMYAEMQKITRNEGSSVIPMFASDLAASSSKVHFENVAADYELDGLRAAERWWFA